MSISSKSRKRVSHDPLAGGAKGITYTVGEMLYPDKFSLMAASCASGIHCYRAKTFKNDLVKWDK